MATWVTPPSASQSDMANRSHVMVEKVRISLRGLPWGPGVTRQATTLFLCTSRPAQRGKRTSMLLLLRRWAGCPLFTDSAARASRDRGSDSGWCLGAPGSNSGTGSQHQMQPDLTTPTARKRRSAVAAPFSFVGGAPQGHGQLRQTLHRWCPLAVGGIIVVMHTPANV